MYSLSKYYSEYNNPYDPISTINSTQNLVDVFFEIGLVEDVVASTCDSLKRVVFLFGNKNEVYSKPEIDFINGFNNVSIYNESTYSRRNRITTRIIIAEISEANPISSCIILTQIINKALQGFNTVFIITKIGIIVSIPILGDKTDRNYQLSKPICNYLALEDMCYSILLAPDTERFLDFYLYMKAITSPIETGPTFEDQLRAYNRGPNYYYLSKLHEVEDLLKIDFSGEIQKYLDSFDIEPEYQKSFESIIDEENNNIFPIVSNPLNTMELKLLSDELEQMDDPEEETHNDDNEMHYDSKELNLLKIQDPEELVKQLKKKYGI